MYNLRKEDINKYILKLIITDKNIDVNFIKDDIILNIETFELPLSKFFNKDVFPSSFIFFMDEINENSVKAIRFRNKKEIPLSLYIKDSGVKFIIDFFPMYKNILKKHKQEYFEFNNYEEFENKVYYLLNIMKIKIMWFLYKKLLY